jgi:hypothetical protein
MTVCLNERELATDAHQRNDERRTPRTLLRSCLGYRAPDTDGVTCVDFIRAKTATTFSYLSASSASSARQQEFQ